MKPTVWTDGEIDYKLMTLNDDRIANKYCVVSRRQGLDRWCIEAKFQLYNMSEMLLTDRIEQKGLTIKQ